MKKRMVIVFAIGISLCLCIGAGALFKATNITETAPISEHGDYIRKGADSSKKIVLADQTQKTLTYKQSSKVSENEYVDIYLYDTDEYEINQDGKLVSFSAITAAGREENAELMISEKEAIQVATEHIKKFYGDLPGYVLDYCNYNESVKNYLVTYSKQFGSAGFVTADSCIVSVSKEGNIVYSIAPRPERFEGFSETLLKGITFEKMQEYVSDQMSAIYSSGEYLSYELDDNVWLKKRENGEFYLNLPTFIFKSDDIVLDEEFAYNLN